jgi:hypothetical protein
MTLLNRIEDVMKLWGMIFPNISTPPAAWIGRLCQYPDEAIGIAIVKASKKFSPDRNTDTDVEHVWRYVAAVTASEAKDLPAPTTSNTPTEAAPSTTQ